MIVFCESKDHLPSCKECPFHWGVDHKCIEKLSHGSLGVYFNANYSIFPGGKRPRLCRYASFVQLEGFTSWDERSTGSS